MLLSKIKEAILVCRHVLHEEIVNLDKTELVYGSEELQMENSENRQFLGKSEIYLKSRFLFAAILDTKYRCKLKIYPLVV